MSLKYRIAPGTKAAQSAVQVDTTKGQNAGVRLVSGFQCLSPRASTAHTVKHGKAELSSFRSAVFILTAKPSGGNDLIV